MRSVTTVDDDRIFMRWNDSLVSIYWMEFNSIRFSFSATGRTLALCVWREMRLDFISITHFRISLLHSDISLRLGPLCVGNLSMPKKPIHNDDLVHDQSERWRESFTLIKINKILLLPLMLCAGQSYHLPKQHCRAEKNHKIPETVIFPLLS